MVTTLELTAVINNCKLQCHMHTDMLAFSFYYNYFELTGATG